MQEKLFYTHRNYYSQKHPIPDLTQSYFIAFLEKMFSDREKQYYICFSFISLDMVMVIYNIK